MKDLLPQITQWIQSGKRFAIARVIQTWGSSPRPVGSSLIVSDDGEISGSVSGGCVEGSVIKEASQVIANKSAKLLSFGVSDDEAWSVGLTCGGKIQVYLQYYSVDSSSQAAVWGLLRRSILENRHCILVTALLDSESKISFIDDKNILTGSPLPESVVANASEAYDHRRHEIVTAGETTYFIHIFPAKSRLLIIGAAHITVDLVQLAAMHDFETWVVDPRGVFASKIRFPVKPDHLLVDYPSEVLNDIVLDGYTYAVILSHDPKIDDNALHILLRSNVAYIGALGSRKTHEKRMERLTRDGFSIEEISRIESPVGIDIHAQGAKEIALSIMGSVIKVKNGY